MGRRCCRWLTRYAHIYRKLSVTGKLKRRETGLEMCFVIAVTANYYKHWRRRICKVDNTDEILEAMGGPNYRIILQNEGHFCWQI